LDQVQLNKVILDLESGSRPKGGININDIDVPSLGAEHLNSYGDFNFKKIKFVSNSFYNNLSTGKIETNDILVVKDGATTGKVSFVNANFPYKLASINEHVFRLKINPNICIPKYVFWYLFSQRGQRQIMIDYRGATVGGISRTFVEKVIIPLVSIPVQIKIADKLDKSFDLCNKRKKAIELLDEYLRSVFFDMFGDPVKNEKCWEKLEFGKIMKSIRYGTGSPPIYSDKGIPFIRATNIKKGTVIEKDIKFISEEEASKISKCKLKEGDLIIVRSGINSGDSAYINKRYSNSYAGFDLIIEIDFPYNIFYNYFINTIYGKSILKPLSRRAGQPHLNAEQISKINVIKPSDTLQTKFVQIVEQVEKTKAKMQESLKEMDNLFNALMQKAFKV
jgi:type I restriction enzyme S subunit